VGTALLLWWYLAWAQTAVPTAVPSYIAVSWRIQRLLIICLIGGAGFCGLVLGYAEVPLLHNLASFSHFVVYTAKVSITSLSIGFLLFSAGWHVSHYHREKAQRM
jgi:hypothetical protein